MLVMPLEVQIGGGARALRQKLRPFAGTQNGAVRDSRIEPDVQDVGFFLELGNAAAVGPFRQEILRRPRVPCVPALGLEDCGDALEEAPLLVGGVLPRVDFAPLAVAHGVEQRDRRPPSALARDHPLVPALDHPRDPLLPPGGEPSHLRNRVERGLPYVRAAAVQAHEPLDGRAEDDRLLASPAVRVVVPESGVGMDQRSGGLEVRDDLGVRFEDFLAPVLRDGRVSARLVDGGEDREAFPLAGREIVLAVPGRRVDEPGARIHRHVVSRHDPERAARLLGRQLAAHLGGKRMAIPEADEGLPRSFPDHGRSRRVSEHFRYCRKQRLRQHEEAAADRPENIGFLRVHGDREV